MKPTTRNYTYIFSFEDGQEVHFTLSLDSVSQYLNTCPVDPPNWCNLDYNQCDPCPLTAEQSPYCPVACSICDLVETFHETPSYIPCTVTCISPERTITKKTVVQEGLASILGLLMATSGCPILDFFRPLARFHLPFATVDESIFRIVAAYLIKQYYKSSNEDDRLFSLDEMRKHYGLVKQVNQGILSRILNVNAYDADKNAIVTFSSLAQILEMEIDANFESLRPLFDK